MPRKRRSTRTYKRNKPEKLPEKFSVGFITTLDGRTQLAQALKQRYDSISTDLGGHDELSAIKSSLLERFVWLEASLCAIEAGLANSRDVKSVSEITSRWIQGVNSLLGIAKTLGIERRIRSTPWKSTAGVPND